jgi:hypothetical protein
MLKLVRRIGAVGTLKAASPFHTFTSRKQYSTTSARSPINAYQAG